MFTSLQFIVMLAVYICMCLIPVLYYRQLNLKNGTELYSLAMHLADIVIPQVRKEAL